MARFKDIRRMVLISKADRTGVSGDATYLATLLGVCDDTLRSRLPYWEDKDWILCEFTSVKSKRGGYLYVPDAASSDMT